MFEDKTFESIMDGMLAEVPNELDKREGSIIWDALAPAAKIQEQVYRDLDQALQNAFGDTANGDFLAQRAKEDGVIKREATPSTRHFQTTGSGKITAGDRFFVNNAVYFDALEDAVIPGTFSAQSEDVGSETAVDVNSDVVPVDYIDGLETITIVSDPNDVDGLDEESDDALRERYFSRSDDAPGPGNNDDYESWAKSRSGVGNVIIDPLWQGEGTVRVIILDQDGHQATQAIIDDVQSYLDPGSNGIGEGKAPEGAKVTVVTADIITVDATIPEIQPDNGYTLEQAQSNAVDALSQYLRVINPGGVIRVREAEAAIIGTAGVLDMGDLLINGARDSIILESNQLVDLGSVSYS